LATTELPPTLQHYVARVEGVLDRVLPPASQAPERLHAAMRYSVLGGGKRIRPMLVYAANHALGGDPTRADAPAAAVEIIHAYSLIHDDLPAMDDDALRRGKPTCHLAFDEATAILAGDALQALAFEVLAGDPSMADHPARRGYMLLRLAAACGAHGMAGGQALDLDAVGKRLTLAELERMHSYKTGALIRASVALGALAARRADPILLAQLDRYARAVGLAFQIRDDILDVEGTTDVIGKQRGAEAARHKPTYPSIVGLDRSLELAEAQRRDALAALGEIYALHPKFAVQDLEDLAHYAVDRAA
jgi:geranylgeranyl pyrophosphate synthase